MSRDPENEEHDAENLGPEAINVIIPLGGKGERFLEQGYSLPKPMIPIGEQSMLEWVLSHLQFQENDTVFLAMMPELEDEFAVLSMLRAKLPEVDIVGVPLPFRTRGAVETLLVATQAMTRAQLERKTISLDCDTIYFDDVLSIFRTLPPRWGCSLYFQDSGADPIYSYIKFTEEKGSQEAAEGINRKPAVRTLQILSIAEKVRISENANTGGYGFPSARVLRAYILDVLANDKPTSGEYYTSSVIAKMLREGHLFSGIYAPHAVCVGTPVQLEQFLGEVSKKLPYRV